MKVTEQNRNTIKGPIITRTYYSKKKGEWVTVEYAYEEKTRKNYKANAKLHAKDDIVTLKSGKLSKMAIKKGLVKQLYKEYGNEYRNYINEVITGAFEKKKSLRMSQIRAILTQNKRYIYIANMGMTPEEVLQQLREYEDNITVDYLLDDSHWVGDFFYSPNGNCYTITFDYYAHTCRITPQNKEVK